MARRPIWAGQKRKREALGQAGREWDRRILKDMFRRGQLKVDLTSMRRPSQEK